MKQGAWRIAGLLGLLIIFLSACQAPLDEKKLPKQLKQSVVNIHNYHFLYRREDYDANSGDVTDKTISNGSLFENGSGEGARIDKKNGRFADKIEVVSNGKEAYYHQRSGQWQHSLEPKTVLRNIVSLSYSDGNKLILHQLKNMTFQTQGKEWIGELQLTKRSEISQFLRELNQAGASVRTLSIRTHISVKDHRISSIRVLGYNGKKKLVVQFSYHFDQFNQQDQPSFKRVSRQPA